jgi:septation ring formation regulator EzrA
MIIETLTNENSDLKLHVEICERRYSQLLEKFHHVDEKLTEIDSSIKNINSMLSQNGSDSLEKTITLGVAIILALSGWIVNLLSK